MILLLLLLLLPACSKADSKSHRELFYPEHYSTDHRTNLCFAHYYHSSSNVPCSPQVMELVDEFERSLK